MSEGAECAASQVLAFGAAQAAGCAYVLLGLSMPDGATRTKLHRMFPTVFGTPSEGAAELTADADQLRSVLSADGPSDPRGLGLLLRGAIVADVTPGGAAEAAGVTKGMLVAGWFSNREGESPTPLLPWDAVYLREDGLLQELECDPGAPHRQVTVTFGEHRYALGAHWARRVYRRSCAFIFAALGGTLLPSRLPPEVPELLPLCVSWIPFTYFQWSCRSTLHTSANDKNVVSGHALLACGFLLSGWATSPVLRALSPGVLGQLTPCAGVSVAVLFGHILGTRVSRRPLHCMLHCPIAATSLTALITTAFWGREAARQLSQPWMLGAAVLSFALSFHTWWAVELGDPESFDTSTHAVCVAGVPWGAASAGLRLLCRSVLLIVFGTAGPKHNRLRVPPQDAVSAGSAQSSTLTGSWSERELARRVVAIVESVQEAREGGARPLRGARRARGWVRHAANMLGGALTAVVIGYCTVQHARQRGAKAA
eukprot:TRINITY_DN65374_c0_g1_i1.p2 TRINITY_DN65374_c0_g1~~TRINITY_DN65374_c0_g1_i1.p2  ORF type:complete len:484 (+),score=95.26 TRINITY_DN65374_c0_g1_i1:80-1531(+)